MSIITMLALVFVTVLVVVVLAACTSYPNGSPADTDSLEGDWIGTASRSQADPVTTIAGARPATHATRRSLKMHSWI